MTDRVIVIAASSHLRIILKSFPSFVSRRNRLRPHCQNISRFRSAFRGFFSPVLTPRFSIVVSPPFDLKSKSVRWETSIISHSTIQQFSLNIVNICFDCHKFNVKRSGETSEMVGVEAWLRRGEAGWGSANRILGIAAPGSWGWPAIGLQNPIKLTMAGEAVASEKLLAPSENQNGGWRGWATGVSKRCQFCYNCSPPT